MAFKATFQAFRERAKIFHVTINFRLFFNCNKICLSPNLEILYLHMRMENNIGGCFLLIICNLRQFTSV